MEMPKDNMMNTESEHESVQKSLRMGMYGMWILIVSLAVLFAATLLGLTVAYLNPANPREIGDDVFPIGFIISTLIIAISAYTVTNAVRCADKGSHILARKSIGQTMWLGYLFLLVQIANWCQLLRLQVTPYTPDMYSFSIYILTTLHALHVVGGLVPLTLINNRYSMTVGIPGQANSIKYLATYWHFLGIVWYVIVGVLWFMK